MDIFADSPPLRAWRLETRRDGNGDCYHQLSTGAESWRPLKRIGHGSFGDVWQEHCRSGPSQHAFRAVKHIRKRQAKFLEMSRREVEALVTFSESHNPEVGSEEYKVECHIQADGLHPRSTSVILSNASAGLMMQSIFILRWNS